MKKYLVTFIIIIIIGCSKSPKQLPAGGGENYVVILQPENEFIDFKNIYDDIFSQIMYTPQPEHIIKFRNVPPEKLYRFKLQKNLMIVGTLDKNDPNRDIIKAFLLEDDFKSIKEGTQSVFGFKEPWAREQYILIIVGRDNEDLKKRLNDHKIVISRYFAEGIKDRLLKIATYKGLDKKAINKMEKYGKFRFSLPANRYIPIVVNPKARIISYITHSPDRMIAIAWRDSIEFPILDEKIIFEFRNNLFKDFFQGDSVLLSYNNRKYSMVNDTVWNDMNVVKYKGVWQNNRIIMGGPFGGYALYHNGKMYMIDYNVANPGKDKIPLIFEMEALLSTFKFIE